MIAEDTRLKKLIRCGIASVLLPGRRTVLSKTLRFGVGPRLPGSRLHAVMRCSHCASETLACPRMYSVQGEEKKFGHQWFTEGLCVWWSPRQTPGSDKSGEPPPYS